MRALKRTIQHKGSDVEATSQKQVDQMNTVYHYLMDNAQGERREYGNDGELQRSTAGEVNPPTSAGRYCRRLESGWWSTEPDVGRVANGIPSRVDRLKSLGNAVVPQVIEVIGLAIRQVSNNG